MTPLHFNGLDWILAGIIVLTIILGIIKGLVREVIGLIAVVLGLIVAGQYYENLAGLLRHIFSSQSLSQLISFIVIFVLVLALGSLLSWLLSRWMKGEIKLFNHLLGGVFGLAKGILIGGVFVLALLVFSESRRAILKSRLAPFTLQVTNACVELVPQELKTRFKLIYHDIKQKVGRHGKEGR